MKLHTRFAFAVLASPVLAAPHALSASAKPAEEPAATQPADDKKPAIQKISIDEFEAKRAEKDTMVLDVRTAREFAAGHVPGAVNVTWGLSDFDARVSKLDKSKTYLVHCARGARSAAATKEMQKLEFKKLFDYAGGMNEYDKSGKPIEK